MKNADMQRTNGHRYITKYELFEASDESCTTSKRTENVDNERVEGVGQRRHHTNALLEAIYTRILNKVGNRAMLDHHTLGLPSTSTCEPIIESSARVIARHGELRLHDISECAWRKSFNLKVVSAEPG